MQSDIDAVIDAVPGLIWTARPDGSVEYVNSSWRDYTGLGAAECLGQGWLRAIHPDDRAALEADWTAMVAGGVDAELDARLQRFDGRYRWFRLRSRALRDASGRLLKWCGLNTDIDDRRRAEEELRARELRFTQIVEGLPAMVTLWSATGHLEFANRQYLEYFGTNLEEITFWERGHAFHPEDRLWAVPTMNRSVETGVPFELEVRRRRVDGIYRWFHTRGLPLRDAEGRVSLWYLLHTDVEERRRTETLLDGERRLLEMVAGGRPMADVLDRICHLVERAATGCHCSVVVLDAAGTRLQYGAAPSLPAGFIQSIVSRPLAVESGPCAMAACLNAPVIFSDLTLEVRLESETWHTTALSHGLRAAWSTPIVSQTGRVLGAFAIYHDRPTRPDPAQENLVGQLAHIASIAIERVLSDAALRRNEAFLAEAQRLSATGSFWWQEDPEEITWSAELYRIYGLDPAVPPSSAAMDARVHPDDRATHRDRLARLRTAPCDLEYEHRLLMPDGSVRHLHVRARPSRGPSGRLEYGGAVQDITARRRSEEALERARAELAHVARVMSLGTLTASIAHEVNQPLAAVLANAEACCRWLALSPPNLTRARESAELLIRDGHRASEVITGLRALFGKTKKPTERLDLNATTREVMALLRSELQRNRVTVHTDLAEDLPPVAGDRVQLEQVILNLVTNACDAMGGIEDRPRQLVVGTRRELGDRVRFSVTDTGVGFPAADAERLFEAFHSTKSGGMGIGLSVSRSIIEDHQGRLAAAANAGPGATFSFFLPAALPEPSPSVNRSASPGSPG